MPKLKGHKDFHESYYEHNCTITEVEDVLKTDIQGNTPMARLLRWWFGLFLLSSSDERSRIFFTSSYAMRMERVRHYRTYRNRIHPLSKFRNFRDVLMLILFIVNKVIFQHNTSYTFGQISHHFYYLGVLIELVIIVDVFLYTQTGYIDNKARKIILEKRDGLLHYGSTKLFLHVASAIPLQCIMFLRYGTNIDCMLCKTNNFITTLKIISVFGLFRVYECSSYLTRERKSYKITHFFNIMRISLLGLLTMLQYIDLCDMIALMCMVASGKLDEASYVTVMIYFKYVLPNPPSSYSFFIFNFARISKSILLFSFNYKRTKFHFDVVSSLLAYLIANLFFMWLILECFNFISRLSFREDRVVMINKALDNMVRCRQLPDKVTKKMNKYFDFNQSKMRAIEQSNGLFVALPDILKRETLLARHCRYVKRIPYFSEWPEHVIEDIALMLTEEIYLNNDLVAEPWVQSEGLLIVGTGELAVYNGDTEIGHLIDGDYFGELSLVTDSEMRTSSVVAVNPSVMLLLEKSVFRKYMREYPDLFFAMKQDIQDNLNDKVRTSQ